MALYSIIIILIIVLLIFLALYMFQLAHENNVKHDVIQFPNFPKSFSKLNIFFISDIHKRIITDDLISNIPDTVDIVIIGGDLMEKGVPFSRVEENVRKLKGIGPVYFVWGNNDYEVDYHYLDSLLLSLDVKILDNTAVVFESSEGEKISLLGVDNVSLLRDRLDLALQDAANGSFKILAAHEPSIVKKFTSAENISFVLSGHTHGGQIRIFNLGPFEKGKIKELDHTTLLNSNGYGTTTLPLRLGAKAETHFITLRSSDNNTLEL